MLILGETGTGKKLIARAIHSLSARPQGPVVRKNVIRQSNRLNSVRRLRSGEPLPTVSEAECHVTNSRFGLRQLLRCRFAPPDRN
ncbi:MAG: sigma 54-interacting transcriptional regulator [Acidobacteriaceae bacterium]|nr:sigma 54-interacting transcriptional regulator [Acidobacteriaceae bacterium]MBV8569992.1 sigma 54-interacting transcriptional regulator [Acidobacteriaceae bacterium]